VILILVDSTDGNGNGVDLTPPCYELATHTVKIRRTGTLTDVMAIWDLSGKYLLFIG